MRDLPWRSVDDGVLWASADGKHSVKLDDVGAQFLQPLGEPETITWAQMESIGVFLPTAPLAGYWFNAAVNAIGPTFFRYNPRHTLIEVTMRAKSPYDVRKTQTWNLGRSRRYSWRLDWILGEVTSLLAGGARWHILGVPGFLDAVVEEIAVTIPPAAWPLANSYLPRLNGRVIGPGSNDERIEAIIGRFASPRVHEP